MKPPRLLLAICLFSGLTLMLACAKQGEGERCDRRAGDNGNDDCQSGLICTPQENLNPRPTTDNPDEGRCCPADRRTASESICKEPGIVRDSGTPSTLNPSDAAQDGDLGDAAVDAASDAADASETG